MELEIISFYTSDESSKSFLISKFYDRTLKWTFNQDLTHINHCWLKFNCGLSDQT